MSIEVKCSFDKMIKLSEIVENPENPNTHSEAQIERLAEIIDFQGMRSPLVISKRSGFLTKGHGRLMALKYLRVDCAPVDFQDYENEAQEYADMVADNEIARWATLDTQKLKEGSEFLKKMDFNLDLLGVKEFNYFDENERPIDNPEIDPNNMNTNNVCPECGYEF